MSAPELVTSYRTHTCGELRAQHATSTVRLVGWVHAFRNHGELIFFDMRDRYGITQCLVETGNVAFSTARDLNLEYVVQVEGTVTNRSSAARNAEISTGDIEVHVICLTVLNKAETLPFSVASNEDISENVRLKNRYLEFRRRRLRDNLILRSQVIESFRTRLKQRSFLEMQTPILTASSPEGARDFLVPSRLHPGRFFALPQSPQQFKQILMIGGFDRYFQIAPCFRDEAARADRSPGEHYQVDIEMSFVTQEDVFKELEPIFAGVFNEFANGRKVSNYPFLRLPYKEAMLNYGSDKPDLRNPLLIRDVTQLFTREDSKFSLFKNNIQQGAVVRGIPAPNTHQQSRAWFDSLNDFAIQQGAGGLGYITFDDEGKAKGPIAKFLSSEILTELQTITGQGAGGTLFFVCDQIAAAAKLAGAVRTKLGEELNLIDRERFEFCWIVDFPMFELDEENQIQFAHNPFSMPRGGMEALATERPLEVVAQQYDIVCNGYELCSGGVRNHDLTTLFRAFEIVGYTREEVEERFAGMVSALKYGAPPHAGLAPGVDRMVMLLAGEANLRQVIAFPMNQQQEDPLMRAPGRVTEKQLNELRIRIVLPKPKS